jgi:tripartite-type tricarboxylate transporter receptor subunit TctC
MKEAASSLAWAFVVVVLSSISGAGAQSFPTKPIRIIVPFGAGTVTDQAGRYIGQKLTVATGQTAIIDNRPGANGIIGAQAGAQAAPDGYTIVFGTNTTQCANQFLYKKLPYDPLKDFAAITKTVQGGIVLVVNAASPAKSLQELIALAKQKPGKLSYGSANSVTLVGMEQLKALSGVDIVNVPYKTLPAVLTDIIGGQIDMAFGDGVTVMPLVRAGKLRALAISTPKRMAVFPDLPTAIEQGVPGFEVTGWLALFAPAKTPPELIAKLNSLIVASLKTPEAVEFFGKNGWEPQPGTPEELDAFVRNETEKWGRMIKTAGIQPE